jgi:hypothetical protein
MTVPVKRGDSLLMEIPSSTAGICKIDVEGYELEACRGLKTFISSHQRFMYCVEVTETWMREVSSAGTAELFALFDEFDFVPHHISRGGELTRFDGFPEGFQTDLVFRKRQ